MQTYICIYIYQKALFEARFWIIIAWQAVLYTRMFKVVKSKLFFVLMKSIKSLTVL